MLTKTNSLSDSFADRLGKKKKENSIQEEESLLEIDPLDFDSPEEKKKLTENQISLLEEMQTTFNIE